MKYIGIISGVIGVIALALTFVPSLRIVGLVLAIAGALLGILGLGNKEGSRIIDNMSIVINFLSLTLYIVFLVI